MRTALVGNGLSMAYNPAFSCTDLFDSLLTAFSADAGSGRPGQALANLANGVYGTPTTDFEGLLGPLDVLANELPGLTALADLATNVDQGTHQALRAAADLLAAVYRRGTDHTLQAIAARSQGAGDYGVIQRYVEQLRETAAGPICIATLNYDGLLYSVLDGDNTVSDLGAGYSPVAETVVDSGPELAGNRLRDRDDLQSDVQLVHLHGSLGWLSRSDGAQAKFKIDDLRAAGYWAAHRDGRSAWSPVVV